MIDPHPTPSTTAANYPPPIGQGTADQLEQWLNNGLYYAHELRVRDMSENRRAELYDKGAQWLREAMAGYEGGQTPAQWVEMYWGENDPDFIPTPVFNEGQGARVNESARLGRPNYRPIVTPKTEAPDVRSTEGAKLMQDMIRHRLRENHWDDKQSPLLYYHLPLYGGAWWKSEFVLRWDQIVTVPVLGAVQCPECQQILASPKIAPTMVPRLSQGGPMAENALAPPDQQGNVGVQACPWCDTHPAMQPYQPTMQEAQGARDVIGQPLGQQQPKGDWEMSIRSDYDMFPRNMGLDTIPGQINEWTEAHVEHLDWIGLRHPDKIGQVKPENPATLARYHPVAGAPDLLYSLLDQRLFENCARVKERHKMPWIEPQQDPVTGQWQMRLNQGRSVIMVGKVPLYDGPLMMKSANYPGEFVERVMVDYIPWEFQDGGRRLRGMGLWKTMFDPQDAGNEIRSQTQAVRKRLAVPIYIALTTHQFSLQGMRGVPGMLAEIEPDPMAPQVLPQLINNTTIDAGVREELKDAIEAIARFGFRTDVEKGDPPPGVSAAIALQVLKGASSEVREPRLARIKASLRRGWGHGAKVMAHMYAEPRPLKFEDDDGTERWRYVQGLDFDKQTDVGIDGEPDTDSDQQQVEQIRDAIQMRVIDPANASPARQRKIAKLLNLPSELWEDEDLQEKAAQREWIEFKDEDRMPRIDPGIDDNSTHYQAHGRACHTAFFRELERKGQWDDALGILAATWATDLQGLGMMQAPVDLQTRILQFWMMKLKQVGFWPKDPQSFKFVVIWRAHTEAHRLEDEMKQMRAMAMPTLAAPGSPTTVAGNQPTEGRAPAALPAAAG